MTSVPGSGILAIAAVLLGAAAVGVDTDAEALQAARENCLLNSIAPLVTIGSADCLVANCSDVTVANINGTVLLSILDDLRRITRKNGFLILTGFPESGTKRVSARISKRNGNGDERVEMPHRAAFFTGLADFLRPFRSCFFTSDLKAFQCVLQFLAALQNRCE